MFTDAELGWLSHSELLPNKRNETANITHQRDYGKYFSAEPLTNMSCITEHILAFWETIIFHPFLLSSQVQLLVQIKRKKVSQS